jgi:hypothetical protein
VNGTSVPNLNDQGLLDGKIVVVPPDNLLSAFVDIACPIMARLFPLLSKAPRAHDQTPLQIAAGDQLFNEQTRHDGLARAWVVRQQKSQWLARQH